MNTDQTNFVSRNAGLTSRNSGVAYLWYFVVATVYRKEPFPSKESDNNILLNIYFAY